MWQKVSFPRTLWIWKQWVAPSTHSFSACFSRYEGGNKKMDKLEESTANSLTKHRRVYRKSCLLKMQASLNESWFKISTNLWLVRIIKRLPLHMPLFHPQSSSNQKQPRFKCVCVCVYISKKWVSKPFGVTWISFIGHKKTDKYKHTPKRIHKHLNLLCLH